MKNVLVTGGAGYIGSHCCKELFKRGYNPVTIDNLIYGHADFVKWGDFFKRDVGNIEHLQECFKKYRFDAVMHFAAFTYVGESVTDPMKYYENNLRNTINLLHCMLKEKITMFIFSSTCATYGSPKSIPMDEKHPQNPINPYGKTKKMIEDILQDYDTAYGLKFTSLRYFNAAGADPECEIGEDHDPETHLIPLVLNAALGKKKSVQIYGDDYPTEDGTCIRDYIHVKDLAVAHVLALEKLQKVGTSDFFNLGIGKGYSVKEVIESASKVTGKEIPFEITNRREGDPPVLLASNQKAVAKLGWKPEFTDIADIIDTAWKWHKKTV